MPGSPLQESLAYSDKITLKYFQNSFMLDFSTLDYSDNGQIKYMYWLENYDKGWNVPSSLSFATYKYLEPGSYIFHVKYCDGAGIWNDTETTLKIVIVPPFWKTNWAMLGYFILMLIALYFTYRIIFNFNRLRNRINVEKQLTEYKLVFFTNISHEFRTPLTLIVSQLEMLMERNDIQPLVYGKLVGIHRNTLRMKRLITELLDFRKQEQGFEKFKYSKQDIYSFLEEIYLSFKEYARGKQIIFEYFNKDRSLDVWFDVVQLEKVIYNLLSNAFKYTPLGGTVSLSVQEYENSVMILISDTGIGIAEENLNKIFDRFYQVDSLDNQKGTGIGLALAKSIIEAHKGKIGARSREGKGTTFVVELPLGDSHISASQKVETPDIDSYCISLLKMDDEKITEEIPEDENSDRTEEPSSKILIVEDNEELRELLVRLFSKVYSVYEAQDGEEGFEKTKEVQPDIVLSDIMMPKMSGIEMCRMIKSNFETSHIPVILLTAQTAEEFTIQGLKMGADDYLSLIHISEPTRH